jgi:hypothetical protein
MNADFLKIRLMEILQRHRGRDKAIPREKLLFELQCFDSKLDDRRLRELYSALPVCTCPDGMFLPKTSNEVQEFKAYLAKGWGPIVADRRVKVIFAYYPSLATDTMKQGELEL